MAEHTRGPWATEPLFGGDGLDIVTGYEVPGAGGAVVLGTVEIDNASPIRPAQARANARLIAAAPDLLESLRGILAWCEATDAEGSIFVADAAEKARAVIARATTS